MSTSNDYAATADELTRRIVALGPKVLTITNPWELFKAGLKCDDIGPSLAQASWALAQAKRILGNRDRGGSG